MDANEQAKLIAQQQHVEERYPSHSELHKIPQLSWCAICQRNGAAPSVVRRTSSGGADDCPF